MIPENYDEIKKKMERYEELIKTISKLNNAYSVTINDGRGNEIITNQIQRYIKDTCRDIAVQYAYDLKTFYEHERDVLTSELSEL